MYPQPQLGMKTSISNYGAVATQAPQPSGIASRVTDLQKAVSELQSLTYQVKASLGIANQDVEAKTPGQPTSLADVLTDARCRITRSSADLQDVISHLNS